MIKFSDNQFAKLSDIISNIGFVTLGSIVLPAIFNHIQFAEIAIGSFATIVAWGLSLWIIKS